MTNHKFLFFILINLIILSSIQILYTSNIQSTTFGNKFTANTNSKLTKQTYSYIWEEYEGAPGNQVGDDSVVFGPDYGPYHNYSEVVSKLQNLESEFPNIVDLFSIGKTWEGREIYGVCLTNESISHPKTEICLVGQHHAREQITAENCLYFIDKIINDTVNSVPRILTLLATKEIYVIPSLNIDGAEILSHFPFHRGTTRPIDEDSDGISDEYEAQDVNGDGYVSEIYDSGYIFLGYEGIDLDGDGQIGEDKPGAVDPNRNYDYQWANLTGASNDPIDFNYCGPTPFSENCTARFRDFANSHNFISAVSLHSGIEMVLPPWSYSDPFTFPIGDEEMYNLTSYKLAELTGFVFEELYPASGEWTDWMYGRPNGTLLTFTLETYGNSSSFDYFWDYDNSFYGKDVLFYHGIWDYFNPPSDQVITNSEAVFPGLLFIAEEAPYLILESSQQEDNDYLDIYIQVTNPSEYVRTNCSVFLEFNISDISGLTLLNATTPIEIGEILAKSTQVIKLVFSKDLTEYTGNISVKVYGAKVGDAIAKFDFESLPIYSEIDNWLIIPFSVMILTVIFIIKRKNQK